MGKKELIKQNKYNNSNMWRNKRQAEGMYLI